MDHPWGLSGPEFLWLYGGALVVSVGLAIYLRWAVRRPRLAEPVPVGDANVVAYLRDGPQAVVETALARLVEQGAVRVTRKGMVTRTTTTVSDPLDQAVLDALGGRTRPVHEVITRAAGVAPIADVERTCAAQKLRVAEGRAPLAHWSGTLVPYLLLVVGLARLVIGIAGDHPVGYLVIELVATVVVIVVLHVTGRSERAPYTVHGKRVRAAAEGFDDVAMRVARDGLGGYPDEGIALALKSTRYDRPPPRPRRTVRAGAAGAAAGSTTNCGSIGAASCGGSSSSSSSGSSCGGGGCGGGGS